VKGGKGTLGHLAYILAIVGGIVLVIQGILGLLSYAVMMPFASPIGGFFGAGIITIILGIVAFVFSKKVNEMLLAVILIVIGFLGGGIGGLLVLVGGILGLASHFI
jgi:hypothetical protein